MCVKYRRISKLGKTFPSTEAFRRGGTDLDNWIATLKGIYHMKEEFTEEIDKELIATIFASRFPLAFPLHFVK